MYALSLEGFNVRQSAIVKVWKAEAKAIAGA
jgi:hypothetical protein